MKRIIKMLFLVVIVLAIPGILFNKYVKASSSNVNVTVPANINAVFNSDGTNTISNYKIMNDSLVPIKVVNVTSSQTNGWELISDTSVLTKDTKKLKLMLDGKVIMNGANAMNIDINDGAEYLLPIKIDRGAWTTTVKESAFNLTFNYEIGKKEFNLSFNSNGGTPINTQKVFNGDVITLPTSVKRGYTQTSWVDANGVTYAPGTKFTMPIGDVNLTATWTINNYELSVKAKVGTSLYEDLSPYGTFDVYVNGKRTDDYITSYSKYLPYNTAYDIRDIKTKPGIKYEGKSVLSMGGTIPDSNVSVELPFSVNTYSIGYNLDGGSITGNPISYKTSSGNLNITNPVKVGYTFNGWTESISPKDWYNGFIDYYIGDSLSEPTYPNAVFSEQIDVHPGTYVLDLEGLAKDQVRIRQYRKDGSYVGNIVGNSYATFNIAEEGYVRVLLLDNNDTAKSTVKLTREVDKATIPTGSAGNRHYEAKWKANTYTIIYDDNLGANKGVSSTHTFDVSQTLTSNTYKFVGHNFKEWNTSPYGLGTSYKNGQVVKNLTTKPGGTITLYAQWERTTQTITVDKDNGQAGYTLTGGIGNVYDLGKPTKTGYNFNGWTSTNQLIGKSYLSSDFRDGTRGPVSLYKYCGGDATGYANLEVVPASSDNPTDSNYELKITNTAPYDYRGRITYVGFSTGSHTKDNTTYYHSFQAKFPKGVKLSLGFNSMGEGGSVGWLTSPYGTGEWETYTYLVNVGKNASTSVLGYIFIDKIDSSLQLPFSWNLGSTRIIELGGTGASNTIAIMSSTNSIATAQWKPISYNVKYDANGGIGTTATSTHSYNSTSTLTPNGFTREYHKFIGWNTKPDGSGTSYANRQSISNLTTVDGSTITLYAQWEGNTITLKYHANGGTRHNYSTGAVLATPSPIQTETQRYDFENPYKTGLASFANDGSLYMRKEGYTHPNISKEWLVNSPTSGITQHGEEPVKYIDIVKKAGKLEQLKTGNVTVDLYANWILKDYTITSNLDGGTVSPTIPTSYTMNSEAIKLANPTKTGHSFNGWTERIKPSVWYKGDLNHEGDVVASTRNAYYSDKLFVKAGQTYKWNSDGTTSGARFYHKDGSTPVYITHEQTGFTPSQDGYIRLLNVYHDTNLDRAKTLYLETITPVKDLTISKGSTGNREYIAKWTTNSYYIDVNGVVDDTYVNVALPITYDVYINGSLVSKGVNDFYKSYPYGSTYEIKNVVAHTGYTYNGITSDSAPLKGTVNAGGTKIKFSITTNSYNTNIGHVALGFNGEPGTKEDYPTQFRLHTTPLTNKYKDTFTLSQYHKVPNGYRFDQYGMRDANDDWVWYDDVNQSFSQIAKSTYGGIYYKPIDYKITYNLNGGTNHSSNPSTYNVLYGVTLKEPTRTGYTFDGWYIDGVKVTGINPGATALFSSAEDFYDKVSKRTTGNKTVEARWTLNKYALDVNAYIDGVAVGTTLPVKFDMYLNGSLWKAGISDFCYEQSHGTKYEVKNIVPNPGYSCSGVATGSLPLSGTVTKASYVVLNITTNNYTIGYNLDGGSMTGQPTSYKVTSEDVTLPRPTKTGYTFAGWTGSNGSTPQKTVTIAKGSTGNKTYTANWKANTYTIAFKTTASNSAGTTPNITATYDTSYNLTANGFTRVGYTFKGWNTKPDGSGTSYANGASVKNLTSTNKGTVTLYAQWKANTYTYNVTYKSSTGKALGTSTVAGTYGSSKSVSAPAKTGYTTPSAQTVKFDSTSAKTITFTYPIVNYTISYNLGGGTVSGNPTSYNVESSTITLKNPAKSGFTFKGWTGSNGSSVQTSVSIASGSTGNKSYTANWTANNYTLTFNANGGSVSTASKVVASGAQYGTLPTPTRTGYTFAGWYTAASGGTKIATTTVMGASNVTVYARWTANTNTKVTVRHNTMNYDGHTYTLAETVSATGTTNSTIQLTSYKKSYTGLTYSYGKVGGSTTTSTTVLANGSRVIDLYYTRNEAKLMTGDEINDLMTPYYTTATTINFTREPIPSNKVSGATVVSTSDSKYKAYMYMDGGTLYVSPESAGVMMSGNPDSSALFYRMGKATKVLLPNLNTTNVNDMTAMFAFMVSLTSVDLSNFNTSNVTDMTNMFGNCISLPSLDVSNFDTSNVTLMSHMFSSLNSVRELKLGNFDTSKVTRMNAMFYECKALTKLDLSNFDTSNVTDFSSMFFGDLNLVNLNLSSFNTSKATKTLAMFRHATKVKTTLSIDNANITSYNYMLDNAATDSNAGITLKYTTATKAMTQTLLNTKSANSKATMVQK